MKTKDTYLVLGSTGFIGTNLVNHLLAQKIPVVSFARSSSPFPKQVNHIAGDFQNKALYKKLLLTKEEGMEM